MRCPLCKSENVTVKDSRPADGNAIRRRRFCEDCHHRFTTQERPIVASARVRKRDGRTEQFDPDKLLQSIQMACHKRGIDPKRLETAAARVEEQLTRAGLVQVSSVTLREWVEKELKSLDDVALIRYRSLAGPGFDSIEDFRQEARRVGGG